MLRALHLINLPYGGIWLDQVEHLARPVGWTGWLNRLARPVGWKFPTPRNDSVKAFTLATTCNWTS